MSSTLTPITGPVYASKNESLVAAFARIREAQDAANVTNSAKIMLAGPKGEGKTLCGFTAPKPLLVHSFDPNGTDTAKAAGMLGDGVLVDKRFEYENLRKPFAFKLWDTEFDKLSKDGTFADLAASGGTYFLDGGYLWMESLMALHRNRFYPNITDDAPLNSKTTGKDGRQLYGDFLEANLYHTRRLLALPCHVVFSAHITTVVDPDTGAQMTTLVTPGKASEAKVPIPFSEVWVLGHDSDGTRYVYTGRAGRFEGSTRIGAGGKLAQKEKPDISAMLRKCGFVVNEWQKGEQ